MDPEDWTALINEAFDQMSKAVFKYEGTIAQLQGDAMLAFFGAPIAHEDDPERAVRAALDMVAMVDEFASQLQATQGITFRIRAGVNTGPVVVGNVGSDLRYEYTALGDAMNVAARMQAAAEPGTVVITDHTLRFVADSSRSRARPSRFMPTG
jgi:class 3 adenylate cyclase